MSVAFAVLGLKVVVFVLWVIVRIATRDRLPVPRYLPPRPVQLPAELQAEDRSWTPIGQ